MRSWDISHRKPFNVDKESITTNVRMSWMKFYFCTNIPGHWKPGLLTNFQLWKYKVSAFSNKVQAFKTHSDHSESDSWMETCLYSRLTSIVPLWTASFPAMFKVTLSYSAKFAWKFLSFAHFLKTFFQYFMLFFAFSFFTRLLILPYIPRQLSRNVTPLLQRIFLHLLGSISCC